MHWQLAKRLEQAQQQPKEELGLDHFEGRSVDEQAKFRHMPKV
jgi:hypothetical protein